jgi:hypothetical protein
VHNPPVPLITRLLWPAGVVCCIVGAAAATTYVSRHELYVDVDGSVCRGGGSLSTCYTIDRAAFSPPAPDLTAYKPNGLGYIEPAPVPGGSLYVGRCEVQAIEVNNVISSRPQFGLLSFLENFSWALPLGMALMIGAGLLYLLSPGTPARLRRTGGAAITAQVGLAALYVLIVYVSWTNSLAVTLATAVVVLFVTFAMLALSGYLFGFVLTAQLAVQRRPREELRVAIIQTGAAVGFLIGLVAVSSLNIMTLWC